MIEIVLGFQQHGKGALTGKCGIKAACLIFQFNLDSFHHPEKFLKQEFNSQSTSINPKARRIMKNPEPPKKKLGFYCCSLSPIIGKFSRWDPACNASHRCLKEMTSSCASWYPKTRMKAKTVRLQRWENARRKVGKQYGNARYVIWYNDIYVFRMYTEKIVFPFFFQGEACSTYTKHHHSRKHLPAMPIGDHQNSHKA